MGQAISAMDGKIRGCVGAATTTLIDVQALPRPASIFTRMDLQKLGITSVVDALRLMPGVDVRSRGPMDVQADFSLRGSTFDQNLILVDGVRLNDSQSGHHNGELPIPISAIDHVEVVNGASSSAHGADALGGVINVVPRKDAHAEIAVVAGEHGLAGFSGSAKASDKLAPGSFAETFRIDSHTTCVMRGAPLAPTVFAATLFPKNGPTRRLHQRCSRATLRADGTGT